MSDSTSPRGCCMCAVDADADATEVVLGCSPANTLGRNWLIPSVEWNRLAALCFGLALRWRPGAPECSETELADEYVALAWSRSLRLRRWWWDLRRRSERPAQVHHNIGFGTYRSVPVECYWWLTRFRGLHFWKWSMSMNFTVLARQPRPSGMRTSSLFKKQRNCSYIWQICL